MVGPAGDRRGAAHLELTWTVFEKEALRAAAENLFWGACILLSPLRPRVDLSFHYRMSSHPENWNSCLLPRRHLHCGFIRLMSSPQAPGWPLSSPLLQSLPKPLHQDSGAGF